MCDLLDAPANGTRSSDTPEFPVDGTLTFDCDSQFTLTGSATLICLPNGTWNGEPPTCGKSYNENIIILDLFKLKGPLCVQDVNFQF